MSRPGFVFDLTSDKAANAVEFRCRNCGRDERLAALSNRDLHARMKAHLVEAHGLSAADEWKVTHQDRNPTEAMVCFWPPESL